MTETSPSPLEVAAWTGSRDLPREVAQAVGDLVELVHANLHITGACIGVDQFVATHLLQVQPDARQRIFIPHNKSRVDLDWIREMREHPNVEVIQMPYASTYFDRNLTILGQPFMGLRNSDRLPVVRPDVLVGVPHFPAGVARSGSWWTINAARRVGIPTMVYPITSMLGDVALADELS